MRRCNKGNGGARPLRRYGAEEKAGSVLGCAGAKEQGGNKAIRVAMQLGMKKTDPGFTHMQARFETSTHLSMKTTLSSSCCSNTKSSNVVNPDTLRVAMI